MINYPIMEVRTLRGKNIAKIRKEKGWSQEMLAKATGLSRGYIASIEEGRRQPRVKTLAIIAERLGVSLEELCNN